MTIAKMMKDRAALTQQLQALTSPAKQSLGKHSTGDGPENLILERNVITLAELKAQLRVSDDRADYLGNGCRRPDSASRLYRKKSGKV
jgi:hypothetical protein